jgi:hypothetical protein
MGVPSVGSTTLNKSTTTVTNLLPTTTPKRSSSAGFNVTTSASSSQQNIFFNRPLGKNSTLNATFGSTQTTGKAGSAFSSSVTATMTQPLSTSVKLRQALNISSDGKGVAVKASAGVNASYGVALSSSTKLSVSGDASIDTNGVLGASATLQASQKLGAGSANLDVTAAANAGSPVTWSVGADASVPIDNLTLKLSAKQVIGGETTGSLGLGLNF